MAAANEFVTARQVLVASLLAAAPLVAGAAPTLPTYAVG